MRFRIAFFLAGFLIPSLNAQPTIGAVLNGASYSPNLSPGCWAALFGSGLTTNSSEAKGVPLPTNLDGVSVSVDGILSPLLYVSPTQINFIIPFEISVTTMKAVPVLVTSPAGASSVFYVRLNRNSPAIFTRSMNGLGTALAFNEGFGLIDAIPPASPVILYAAGLGPTNPPAASNSGGSSTEPLNRVVDPVSIYIGDKPANVLFAGLAPGFPGIYQVNVIPSQPITDRFYVRVGNWQSNITELHAGGGANATGVAGSISPLYPSGGSTPSSVSTSAVLTAASFNVAFDVPPTARPFTVLAVSEAATALISLNPETGTYDATLHVPTAMVRAGDLSLSEFSPLWDFRSCSTLRYCMPFVANIIPVSRLEREWLDAMSQIPMPNVFQQVASATALFRTTGTFQPGSRFIIDRNNHPELTTFGGLFQIEPGLPRARSTSFKLYVDGNLINSKDITYNVISGQ